VHRALPPNSWLAFVVFASRIPVTLSSTLGTDCAPCEKQSSSADSISDALPFGRLWYGGSNAVANAIGYATHRSRSHNAVIRVYDDAGNVTETHEHAGEFKECEARQTKSRHAVKRDG